MLYYIRYQGRKQGPISETHLMTLLERGTVTQETEASIDEVRWKPLGEFPEFKRFCSQAIARQREFGPYPVAAPVPRGLDPQSPLPLPIISDHQSNAPHQPFAIEIEPQRFQATSFPPRKKDWSALYAVLAGAAGFLLLLVVLLVVFFESDRLGLSKDGLAKKQESLSNPDEEPIKEPPTAPLKKERDRYDDSTAGSESAEDSDPETKPDDTLSLAALAPPPPPLAAPEPPAPQDPPSPPIPAVSSLPSVFPVKPLARNAFGKVNLTSSNEPVFASLYSHRQHIQLRYVSYVPGSVFVAKNSSAHEVRVSHNGNPVLRLALEQNGLNAVWLDSSGLSQDTYQTINGALLAELEIAQQSNGQTLKSLSLIDPIETEAFKTTKNPETTVSHFAYDFPSLGLTGASLSVTDVKGHRSLYEWASTSDDTLRFKVEDGYHARIRIVPQTPAADDGKLKIPIAVNLIERDCPLLDRYARETNISPDQLDQTIETGTKATKMARSEMQRLRRVVGRNNTAANKANTAINVLNRRLPFAKGPAATDIKNQISRQKSIISARRSDNKQVMPHLQRAAARYDDYSGKLRVFKNYKALFDKPSIIYESEPITFSIHLTYPGDRNKKLLLSFMKPPDMSTESNAVIPPMPTDEDDDDNDDDDDDEEEMEDKDLPTP